VGEGHQILAPRGGIIGQTVFDEAGLQALSELPGRDQLRAQVVGMLQSPSAGWSTYWPARCAVS